MTIRFAPEAAADLEAAVEFISERDPSAAARVAERVLSMVDRLARGEFEGPEQVLASGERVRSWPVRPLRIYYQRSTDGGATWADPRSGQPLLRGALSSPRNQHEFHPQVATAPDGGGYFTGPKASPPESPIGYDLKFMGKPLIIRSGGFNQIIALPVGPL